MPAAAVEGDVHRVIEAGHVAELHVLNGRCDLRPIGLFREREIPAASPAAKAAPVVADDADLIAFGEVEAKLGSVDIVVNNAGIQHVAALDEFPVEKWEQIVAINLSSNFYTARAALPGMKRRGWGRIINIASAHGLVASPFNSAYVAAKHGVLGLTKTIALEVAETPITCNAICLATLRRRW